MSKLTAAERAAVRALATGAGRPVAKRGAGSYREGAEQALFAKRMALDPRTRDLAWSATMTGVNLGVRAAAIRKAQGVRPGVPDFLLYEPGRALDADDYGERAVGLALEFKNPDGRGRVSEVQGWWHARLRRNGWRVAVVTSAGEAWDHVVDYLGLTR